MVAYNGNAISLTIDGITVAAEFKEVQLTESIEEVDVTRGSGTTHRQRLGGLKDSSISITLGWETGEIPATYAPLLEPGLHTVVYGPEGTDSGKPKHEQQFLFTSMPHTVSVEKSEVVLQVSGNGAATPVSSIANGDTF